MPNSTRRLVLASTSPYRQHVLRQLRHPFETFAPHVDESPLAGETARELVLRLAKAKAEAARSTFPDALVIGSDQVAVHGHTILGKPGTHTRATEQLRAVAGNTVHFLTGLCLLDTANEQAQADVIDCEVLFRQLSPAQIEHYLQTDRPYDTAGSFKSEGYGAALLEHIRCDDPNALIGLPLMRLTRMLSAAGMDVLMPAS